jgi:hypothetical protein
MFKIALFTGLLVLAVLTDATAQVGLLHFVGDTVSKFLGGEMSSDSGFGSNSSHTEWRAQFAANPHNPSTGEQHRLRVEWAKAVARSREPFHSHRVLAVPGRVLIASDDGKTVKPADWLQGVRVVLARKPNVHQDWSKRHDERDSVWADCVVEKGGRFTADFQPYQVRRPVGGTAPFQVALALGTHSGRHITWRNTNPVLAQSVAMIEIAGPSPISPILQAINGAPSVDGERFNPVMLIRAVNCLHALGKQRQLKKCETIWQLLGIGATQIAMPLTLIPPTTNVCF